jgi:hypothetical protein
MYVSKNYTLPRLAQTNLRTLDSQVMVIKNIRYICVLAEFSAKSLSTNCMYLLFIAGRDGVEKDEIFEAYMYFGQIAGIGRVSPLLTSLAPAF